jgi:hypothetical protein
MPNAMARRKKHKVEDFPAVGSVFSMPLADGRLGICRVLRIKVDIKGYPVALVAASDWIGHSPPPLDDPSVRRTLILRHHAWAGSPECIWVSDLPPKTFRNLGRITLSKEEKEIDCLVYSGWEGLQLQVLLQWRWDNEREAVLREDAEKKAIKEKKSAKAASDRQEYLLRLTLPQLLSKELFPTWKEYPKAKDKRAIEQIIKTFVRTLSECNESLTREFVAKELQSCVVKLNDLDEERRIIETVEREDLFDVFEEILYAAGQPGLLSVVDDTRDW